MASPSPGPKGVLSRVCLNWAPLAPFFADACGRWRTATDTPNPTKIEAPAEKAGAVCGLWVVATRIAAVNWRVGSQSTLGDDDSE